MDVKTIMHKGGPYDGLIRAYDTGVFGTVLQKQHMVYWYIMSPTDPTLFVLNWSGPEGAWKQLCQDNPNLVKP